MTSSRRTTAVHAAIRELQRLSEIFQRRRVQLAREVDLTEHQWRVLEQISSEHFIPSMFARDNESSAAAVSKTIRQLLDKELITVSISATDGRQRDYELSALGKQRLAALRKLRKRAIDTIWATMPESQLEDFTATAAELTARIEAYAAKQDKE
ncbi:MAG: hypothetical protein OXU20_12425 [Myxococcales bacterium]|nr:hypothetical protein [Myxococcales bacterium]MDD9968537.1 hypothetical protein [Myxococcales bacterium]